MNQTQAAALIHKHGSVAKAAAAVNMARSTFYDIAKGQAPARRARPQNGALGQHTLPTAQKGRSLTDFDAVYNKDFIIPRKIRDGLRAMPGVWEYETEFIKRAGVSQGDIANYRQHYQAHIVLPRDGRKVWAKTAKIAEQMRSRI